MSRKLTLTFFIAGFALAPGVAPAQGGGCTYNRTVYAEGTEVCRDGALQRCESGNWGDIGLCDDSPLPPPPEVGGGDVPEGERPLPPPPR